MTVRVETSESPWPFSIPFRPELVGTPHSTMHTAAFNAVFDEPSCPYCHPKPRDRRPLVAEAWFLVGTLTIEYPVYNARDFS